MSLDKRYSFEWRLFALHLIYFVLLLWVYTTYITDSFSYSGFHDSLNVNKARFAPIAITAAFALLRNNGLPSYFFLNIIIALTITPSLVIFSGSDLPLSFIAVTWFAFALLAMVPRIFKLRTISVKYVNSKKLLHCFAVLSLLFIASIFAFGGGRFINFDLSLVYDFRQDASDNLPWFFGYLMPNFSKAIIPLGVVLSLLNRRWLLLLVFIFCAVMIFALSSHKAILFMPFVVILIYWFSLHPKVTNLFLLALISLVVIGGLDFYLNQLDGIRGYAGWIGSLGVRRFIMVPALLNWNYYDFFSVNPYDYWSKSKLTFGLIDNSYGLNIADLIGIESFGTDVHANTGWIGSGMANAGHFGIALYSVLIGLLLSFVDAYAKKLGNSLVLSAFLIPVAVASTSSDFTSMLLTHGLFALLLIVMILKPDFNKDHLSSIPETDLTKYEAPPNFHLRGWATFYVKSRKS